jgi:hypothetical protein
MPLHGYTEAAEYVCDPEMLFNNVNVEPVREYNPAERDNVPSLLIAFFKKICKLLKVT